MTPTRSQPLNTQRMRRALTEREYVIEVRSYGVKGQDFDALYDRVANAAHSQDEQVFVIGPAFH